MRKSRLFVLKLKRVKRSHDGLMIEGKLLLSEKLHVLRACRDEVLKEFHCYMSTVHPGSTNMYKNLQL